MKRPMTNPHDPARSGDASHRTPSAKTNTKLLKELHRGELSAVETYEQALSKLGTDPASADLQRFEGEHREAVRLLSDRIVAAHDTPDSSSGAWGSWAKLVQGTAKQLGRNSTIKALKEGEEHGLKDYERALEEDDLDVETRNAIETQLLPRQRTHVQHLDRFLG